MSPQELYMKRCIELALNGAGYVSPNPMVGAVIVHNNRIIGEGWHKKYGEAHAEVNAVNNVADKNLFKDSEIYVNLEPCSHQGKTPPCADLLIKHKFKRVIIGSIDPNELVSGKGIQKLQQAGIEVVTGVLQKECNELNKRFITFHTKQRPYIILKWARTSDGFISPDRETMNAEEFESKRHITGLTVQKLVHKWRSEEDAILIGTNTALTDNPALNVRAWQGPNPTRVIIDKELKLPLSLKIFDRTQPTIIFNAIRSEQSENLSLIQLDFEREINSQIIEALFKLNIQSLIIEGGKITLESFINKGIWDEAQVFTSDKYLHTGITSPEIHGKIVHQQMIGNNQLTIYRNI